MRGFLAGLLVPVGLLAGVHGWLATPSSPPVRYALDPPTVAIVGGRAEHCLVEAWEGAPRVVNLARTETDWRALVDQIDFALARPPAILVVSADPEQLLFDRRTRLDPDARARQHTRGGGVWSRIYAGLERISLPRLVEQPTHSRFHPDAWGAAMSNHWSDPAGLAALSQSLRDARLLGVKVLRLPLPLPNAATTAWRAGPHGEELEAITRVIGPIPEQPPGASFPDGITCNRITGRAWLSTM